MDDAVGRERRVISEHLQRSEGTTLALSNRAESIERGLSGLATDVGSLTALPGDVRALADVVGNVDRRAAAANDKLAAANDKLADANDKLAALQRSIKEVADRPAPDCPACVCDERLSVATALAPKPAGNPPLPTLPTLPKSLASPASPIARRSEGADRP